MGVFQFIVSISIPTGVFTIFALGLNLKWGFSGLLDIGHVAYFAIGAYTTALLNIQGLNLFFAVLAGMILAGLAEIPIGFIALRLKDDYLAIVTLAFAQILHLPIKNAEWLTKGMQGLSGFSRPFENLVAPLDYNYFLLGLVIGVIILVYIILEKLVNSPWGRVLKSIREDEVVTSFMGKNVLSYKIQTLALGSAIAGLAGALWAFNSMYLHPNMFIPMITFYAWIAVVLGGSADNRGSILGTVLIWGLLINGTRFLTPYIPLESTQLAAFRVMLIGIILMLLMRFKPEGIFGKREELSL